MQYYLEPGDTKMKITKKELTQIIKEELEAELAEDMYGTEEDRPLDAGRSLMSAKNAERALEMAEDLAIAVGGDEAISAMVADLVALLKTGVVGEFPSSGTGPASEEEMEDYESDYRDPPSKPLDMSGGRKVSRAQRRREAEMMKDYDI